MNEKIVDRAIVHLEGTVATRSYPFTQDTLDKIGDLRRREEDRMYESHGVDVIVPAPVIISRAIDLLHNQEFSK